MDFLTCKSGTSIISKRRYHRNICQLFWFHDSIVETHSANRIADGEHTTPQLEAFGNGIFK